MMGDDIRLPVAVAPVKGSPLYERTIAYDYGDPERNELMGKVWSVTPWMVNARTGSPSDDTFRDIPAWCHRRCGCEAWPIHGLPGSWQFGSATIFGWTFVGFEKENDMAAFCDAWEVER